MRRPAVLVLALLAAAAPADAQIRVTGEIALPAAPAYSPSAAFTATGAIQPLIPALTGPSVSASPLLAAPVQVTAQVALARTGAALSAAAKDNADQGAVSRRAFDSGAKAPAEAPEVAGRYSSIGRPALPEANAPQARVAKSADGPIRTAAHETIEVGTMLIPLALVSFFAKSMLAPTGLAAPALLALWGLGFWAMRDHLAAMRSTVVGGWQASHDQKYRVDYSSGKLRDVRGQKYGEDRYEERAPGAVGPRALTAIGLAAAAGAAAFLLL